MLVTLTSIISDCGKKPGLSDRHAPEIVKRFRTFILPQFTLTSYLNQFMTVLSIISVKR
ncbi:MAG: hypothetical protein AAFQ41_11810 [Cyanobacteria bacterium J06623_7]